MRAEIPGIKKEDVTVEVDGNFVSISVKTKQEKEKKEGERVICRECYQGSSYRSFSLDRDVDESKSHAKYDGGVLELTLPKNKTARPPSSLRLSRYLLCRTASCKWPVRAIAGVDVLIIYRGRICTLSH